LAAGSLERIISSLSMGATLCWVRVNGGSSSLAVNDRQFICCVRGQREPTEAAVEAVLPRSRMTDSTLAPFGGDGKAEVLPQRSRAPIDGGARSRRSYGGQRATCPHDLPFEISPQRGGMAASDQYREILRRWAWATKHVPVRN
jgi:hypothetical protein